MEDFHFREKMTHFDHERIPERVVHARGSAAHGYFQVYESMAEFTKAKFLTDPPCRRLSSCASRQSSASAARRHRARRARLRHQVLHDGRQLRPRRQQHAPFFIQDGIKFPDLVHAIKPEPHHEMPQASAAHDTFWDFISLMPESAHMIMWVLSDRALPAQLPHDGGIRRPHLPLDQRAGPVPLRQVPLAPTLGTPRWCGTKRRRSPARTPTSTAATSGRPSRWATTPSTSSACR
jgi:catalase